jgi:hypothetical protein
MSRTNYRTLIDLGRKAGLKTSELYSAMSGRPPEAQSHTAGHSDGNGFVSGLTQSGRVVYRPAGSRRR